MDTSATIETTYEKNPAEQDHSIQQTEDITLLPPSQDAIALAPINNTTASDRLRGLTDASLRFFANASNETLGACAVGLCASTYLVLGRVGLVLIGAVGGIVLHATWEAQSGAGGESQKGVTDLNRRKREVGAEVVKRVLDWRNSGKGPESDANEASGKVNSSIITKPLDYSGFQPETASALTSFTDAVVRDYVKWWYGPILPTELSFPAACRQTLAGFILSFSNHISRKRAADPFLDFLANSTSIVIVFLSELSMALKASQRAEPEEAVRTYLLYQPESNLANVLSTEQQDRKLDLVADDILQNFLDSKAYNFPPSKTFLQEVLAKLILSAAVTKCAKPEWINGWIVYLLEEGEPEIMNVIDAGVEDMGSAIENTHRRTSSAANQNKGHQRRVSRAEEAMQEALLEAKKLNEMIAEDEARRRQESTLVEAEETASTANTEPGIATPTSSDSDPNRWSEQSMESSMVFDSDGNPQYPASPGKAIPFTSLEVLNSHALATLQPSLSQVSEVPFPVSLSLHNASITIFDDSDPSDRSTLKQKPTSDYLLQIEPASSRFPGWMISRKYTDFEALHEILRRIAIISGVPEFAQKHPVLPTWKATSQVNLTHALENYLRQATRSEPLAESEAMKKFLEKETGLEKGASKNKNVLDQSTAALENVGKGFINVLGQGGKGIAGGGKAVLGGVQGVLGAVTTGVVGPKKSFPGTPRPSQNLSRASLSRPESYSARPSIDSAGTRSSIEDATKPPPLPSRTHGASSEQTQPTRSRSSSYSRPERSQEGLNLPPPPSEITADYTPVKRALPETPPQLPPRSTLSRPTTPTPASKVEQEKAPQTSVEPDSLFKHDKKNVPITEEETRVSIELIFAIITELYSLSGAWTIRLSLLSAAKTFLLRPNNPQLDSIRALIQDSIIEANFSDAGLAAHINKLRENVLPTEEELKKWPAELTAKEKEKLRIKARKLLVERGMPQALTSVMGAAASGEALGRVFDCLQIEEVARGFIFAVMLQALRAATQ